MRIPLTELTEKSEIRRYRLQTVAFPLEKVQITGFVGSICIHMGGTDTLAEICENVIKIWGIFWHRNKDRYWNGRDKIWQEGEG